jgi:hypothetical protein
MVRLLRSRKSVDSVKKRISESVKPELPREILTPFNEENMLFLMMSPEGRRIIKKAREHAYDVTLGARQVLIARLAKVKYAPRSAYAQTKEAIEDLYGVPFNLESGPQLIDRLQNWRADAYVFYDERGGGKTVQPDALSSENVDEGLIADIRSMSDVSIKGYFTGIEVLDKLGNGDKIFLLSTLEAVGNKLQLDFPDVAAVVYEENKPVTVKPSGKTERPLLDGYIRMRFSDPDFREFDAAVEKHLNEIMKNEPNTIRKYAGVIWKTIKPYIHSIVPAYHNFLGVDPSDVPKQVAETVKELAHMYKMLKDAKSNPFKHQETAEVMRSVAEALGKIYGLPANDPSVRRAAVNLFLNLVPDNIEEFAITRTPYIISRLGERLSTGFSMEQVFKYVYEGEHALEISQALLKIGVVLTPQDIESISSKHTLASEGSSEVTISDAIARYVASNGYRAVYNIYTLFYSLGIPVIREFASSGSRISMYVTITTNIKSFIDKPEILDMEFDPKVNSGVKVPKVGTVFFRGVDKVIKTYIKNTLLTFYKDRQVAATDPRIYQGVLYLFTDRDLVNGFSTKKLTDISVCTKLLDVLQAIAFNVASAKMIGEQNEKVIRMLKEGKVNKKVFEFVGKITLIKSELDELERKIAELARIYNPKYIGYLSKKSEAIYSVLLNEASATTSPPPTQIQQTVGEKKVEDHPIATPLAQHLSSVSERLRRLTAIASSPKLYQDYSRETAWRRGEKEDRGLDSISDFFRSIMRGVTKQLEEERRHAAERRRRIYADEEVINRLGIFIEQIRREVQTKTSEESGTAQSEATEEAVKEAIDTSVSGTEEAGSEEAEEAKTSKEGTETTSVSESEEGDEEIKKGILQV